MRTKNYYKSTPVKMRKIGDAILMFSVSISGMIMTLPVSDNAQKWLVFIIGAVGVAGKIITNFFTDEDGRGENV